MENKYLFNKKKDNDTKTEDKKGTNTKDKEEDKNVTNTKDKE